MFSYKITSKKMDHGAICLILSPVDKNNSITNFKLGQHILLSIPESNESRPFTLSAPPKADGEIELIIKIYQNFTKKVAELEIGTAVTISQVFGNFIYNPEHVSAVFLAGGSGVTPFIAAIQYIIEKNLPNDIILLDSNKNLENTIYFEKLENISNEHNNIKSFFFLTDNSPSDWSYETGRINKESVLKYCKPITEKYYYICGPKPFIEALVSILTELNIPKAQIITAYY